MGTTKRNDIKGFIPLTMGNSEKVAFVNLKNVTHIFPTTSNQGNSLVFFIGEEDYLYANESVEDIMLLIQANQNYNT